MEDQEIHTRRPVLLDLFCGAGGAAMGYHRAGFEVIGVDLVAQPRYPFAFERADALELLGDPAAIARNFDAVHASPPCQAYSALRWRHGDRGHPDLVDVVRAALGATGLPWVIENVDGSPVRAAVVLCGSMFGLGATCRDGRWRQLRRHRRFETPVPVMAHPCYHRGGVIGVYGHTGVCDRGARGYTGSLAEAREAMGVDWMGARELAQAIPPAYTEHVGAALLAALRTGGPALAPPKEKDVSAGALP